MRKIILILIILKTSLAFSQQETMYTHYMYNVMSINPAYAGYEQLTTITLLHRSQWAFFPGAPLAETFSIQSDLGGHVGAGFSAVNNKYGPERNIALKSYYSYTIRTNKKMKISFGLKAGLNNLYVDLTNVSIDYPDDPAFRNNIRSAILPSFGFGVLMYTDNYYFGISVPDLVLHDYIHNDVIFSTNLSLVQKKYYLIGGSSTELTNRIIFKSSAIIGISKNQNNSNKLALEANFSTLFVLDNTFAGGLMYRSKNTLAFLAGMKITKEFEFSYSFDMVVINNANTHKGASHEIVLKYTLGKNKKYRRRVLSCPTFQ